MGCDVDIPERHGIFPSSQPIRSHPVMLSGNAIATTDMTMETETGDKSGFTYLDGQIPGELYPSRTSD